MMREITTEFETGHRGEIASTGAVPGKPYTARDTAYFQAMTVPAPIHPPVRPQPVPPFVTVGAVLDKLLPAILARAVK